MNDIEFTVDDTLPNFGGTDPVKAPLKLKTVYWNSSINQSLTIRHVIGTHDLHMNARLREPDKRMSFGKVAVLGDRQYSYSRYTLFFVSR